MRAGFPSFMLCVCFFFHFIFIEKEDKTVLIHCILYDTKLKSPFLSGFPKSQIKRCHPVSCTPTNSIAIQNKLISHPRKHESKQTNEGKRKKKNNTFTEPNMKIQDK
ncbi:hypothetical protein AB205_0124480, partial [Aquarana catesbeiana]